ncbi:PAS domain-containing sensor histidine kinase [Larkinella insperata]|uniref:histidine kinase n=1 Tax=Larkinella insperata TaxID=332158 RepID=A0ABW3QKQ9_9BACT|nr:PAS domain-containing sensor histidine kinase [Larkinella insperata]
MKNRSLSAAGLLKSAGSPSPEVIQYAVNIWDEQRRLVDFECIRANAPLGTVFGLEPVGRRYSDLWAVAGGANLLESFKWVAETGDRFEQEIWVGGNSDNPDYWFNVTARRCASGLIVKLNDITAIKRAQRPMSESWELLEQVMIASGIGIKLLQSIHDESGTLVDFAIVQANKAAHQLLQRTDLIGRRWLETYPRDWQNGLFHQLVAVSQTGERLQTDVQLTLADQRVWYSLSATQMPDGIALTYQDITDRKQAEEQLQQTAENLQAVLDASPTAIGYAKAVYDDLPEPVDFQIVVCNQKFAQFTGLPLEQLPGQSIAYLSKRVWGSFSSLEPLNMLQQTGAVLYRERQEELTGQHRWLGIAATRHQGGLVLTALDITDLKEAEAQQASLQGQLARSQQTLEELEQLRQKIRQQGEFLRSTTHDLRGSFGIIQGVTHLVNLADTEPERSNILHMLERNVSQMTHMLTQLLDYARLQAGQEKVELARFNVSDLLHPLLDGIQVVDAERGLTVSAAGPENLWVTGDRVKIRRIVQNLLLNAVRYTGSGSVRLTWGTGEEHWWLGVEDTGPGLPPALIYRLTGHSATEDEVKFYSSAGGEGIGLFIVNQLVDLLGGQITVESQLDQGTQIRVVLPRIQESTPAH